jgi:hypothetical protein
MYEYRFFPASDPGFQRPLEKPEGWHDIEPPETFPSGF